MPAEPYHAAAEPRPTRGRHVSAPWRPASFGRALSLVLMSAVLPGTAQITAGRHRWVGRVALGVWVLLLVGLLGVVGYIVATEDLGAVLTLAVRPRVLQTIRVAALLGGILWLLLLLDAWRLSRPATWRPSQRVVSTVTLVAVAVTGFVPAAVASQYAAVQTDVVNSVFREETEDRTLTATIRRQRPDGRINILLLGGDGGKNRDGIRTDSMQVASVDRRTGRTVLVALPRSLQRAPFPAGSPLDEVFPNGFDAYDRLLNGVYRYGADNPRLLPGANDPGAQAIMQAAGELTGLAIDYYVLVNLDGFRDLVDAMGGVELYVPERLPVGGRANAEGVVVEQPSRYLEPGLQTLDGYETLWFARSRIGSDDYARMRRQRCVLSAILAQANPHTVLLNYQDIARSTKNLVSTNIPRGQLPELVEIALDARKHDVASVTLTRDVIDTVDPDAGRIRALVAKAIQESTDPGSTDLPRPGATAAPDAPAAPAPSPTERPDAEPTGTSEPVDVTADLDAVCR